MRDKPLEIDITNPYLFEDRGEDDYETYPGMGDGDFGTDMGDGDFGVDKQALMGDGDFGVLDEQPGGLASFDEDGGGWMPEQGGLASFDEDGGGYMPPPQRPQGGPDWDGAMNNLSMMVPSTPAPPGMDFIDEYRKRALGARDRMTSAQDALRAAHQKRIADLKAMKPDDKMLAFLAAAGPMLSPGKTGNFGEAAEKAFPLLVQGIRATNDQKRQLARLVADAEFGGEKDLFGSQGSIEKMDADTMGSLANIDMGQKRGKMLEMQLAQAQRQNELKNKFAQMFLGGEDMGGPAPVGPMGAPQTGPMGQEESLDPTNVASPLSAAGAAPGGMDEPGTMGASVGSGPLGQTSMPQRPRGMSAMTPDKIAAMKMLGLPDLTSAYKLEHMTPGERANLEQRKAEFGGLSAHQMATLNQNREQWMLPSWAQQNDALDKAKRLMMDQERLGLEHGRFAHDEQRLGNEEQRLGLDRSREVRERTMANRELPKNMALPASPAAAPSAAGKRPLGSGLAGNENSDRRFPVATQMQKEVLAQEAADQLRSTGKIDPALQREMERARMQIPSADNIVGRREERAGPPVPPPETRPVPEKRPEERPLQTPAEVRPVSAPNAPQGQALEATVTRPQGRPGPADNPNLSPKDVQEIEKKREEGRPMEEQKYRDTISKVDVTNNHVKKAVDLIKKNPNWTTGRTGSVIADLPLNLGKGTDAHELQQAIKTITSNLSIETLKEMKSQSATGASGFGALNEKELDLIMSNITSLDQGLRSPRLLENLEEVLKFTDRIKDSAGQRSEALTGQKPAASERKFTVIRKPK